MQRRERLAVASLASVNPYLKMIDAYQGPALRREPADIAADALALADALIAALDTPGDGK
jgi:hypothetical protein